MCTFPEMPLVPLLHLMHFGIALFLRAFFVDVGASMTVMSTIVPPCISFPDDPKNARMYRIAEKQLRDPIVVEQA